jgi:hypothetical protein
MRLFQILESTEQAEDQDPFGPPSRSAKDQDHQARRSAKAALHLDTMHSNRMTEYVRAMKIEKLASNRTRGFNPNDVITVKGQRYIIRTTDPVERAKIIKTAKKVSQAQETRSEVGGLTLRQTAALATQKKQRWPAGDKVILDYLVNMKSPLSTSKMSNADLEVRNYFLSAVHAPWPEIEPLLLKHIGLAASYVLNCRKTKWPEFETAFLNLAKNYPQALEYGVFYAQRILKHRWPALEPLLLAAPLASGIEQYSAFTGKWPEFETKILASNTLSGAMPYAKHVYAKVGWPALEARLLASPLSIITVNYAINVLQKRWKPLEDRLAADIQVRDACSFYMVHYSEAFNVTDWPAPVLKAFFSYQDSLRPQASMILDVLKKRVPEFEKTAQALYNSSRVNLKYVLKSREVKWYAKRYRPTGRWPEIGIY